MSNYKYKNKDFSEEDIIKAAETANLSVNDYVDKHKISRIEDEVDPSVSLENVRKKETPEFKSTQISLEDINVDRGEGLFSFIPSFNVEGNVVKNLKDHYKGTRITFSQANVGKDAVKVKNKAGDIETFKIPSIFNKGPIDLLGEEIGGMKDFHKKITDFIAVGNKNLDPELESQQRNIEYEILENLDNTNSIRNIIPDFTGNWEAIEANDDGEKDDLISGILKQFGEGTDIIPGTWENVNFEFDSDYSKLSETDYQYALDKLITLKATEQSNFKADEKLRLAQTYLPTENSRRELHDNADAAVYEKFSKEEKALYGLFKSYEELIGVEGKEAQLQRESLEKEMQGARKKLGNLFDSRRFSTELFVLDLNGNYVDPTRHGKGSQIVINNEEYDDAKNLLEQKTGGRREYIRDLSNVNHEKLYVSSKEGDKMVKVVINDQSVFKSLINDHNLKPIDKTKNGFVFEMPKSLAAHNYNYMVKGDGYDMWKDFMNKGEGFEAKAAGQFIALKAVYDMFGGDETDFPDFDSPDGHFGLLEFDESQTFEGVEKTLGVDLRNSVGISWWDQDEYADNDLSKEFKRELKGWRDDRKGLVSDRKILNDMHLLNIDPGSNTLSLSIDFDDNVEGETTLSFDPIKQATSVLYEGFGDALGFEADANVDLNVWSARASNDALESFAYSSGFELDDEQKERVKRSGAYKVFEGVVGFVPAITEFALIEAATMGTGTALGLTRLGGKLVTSYKVGEKGVRLTAKQMAKRIGYKGPIGSKKFDAAILKYNKKVKKKVVSITDRSAKQKAMFHGFNMLKEEAKMRIAFEDDYKIGMGAGFYIAGVSLPRFTFGRGSVFGEKSINVLNAGLKMGRKGVAGATGSLAASNLEAFVEDVRGNTTYGKYLNEEYSDLSETGQQGLIDFFTFALVGMHKSGLTRNDFRGTKRLDRLHKQTGRILGELGRQKMNNTESYKKDPVAWNKKYDKYLELHKDVDRVLKGLEVNAKWEDMSTRRKIVERSSRNAENVVRQLEGMEKFNIKIKEDNTGFQTDGIAEFRPGSKNVYLDLSKLQQTNLSHEMGHVVLKALFKSNPEMSKA